MYRPTSTFDLVQRVRQEINVYGAQCDLNHIDVSRLASLEAVFMNSDFNGDISGWDVSCVAKMSGMFQGSQFNGDISGWRPVALKEAYEMFRDCPFQGDLSRWELPNMTSRNDNMLIHPFRGKVPNWYHYDRNLDHWDAFRKQYPSDFQEFLTTWDDGHAVRPSIVLADLFLDIFPADRQYASPALIQFSEQYEAVVLVINSFGLEDVQTKFDMAADQLNHFRHNNPQVAYHLPFEAA